jgi:DNA polymerase-3 subunit gamma/tau
MTYLPFARKYRPQTLEELIGQSHVTATLTRALETRRVAQAYLFAGQRGVGKTSAARILAKCLNCAKGPTAAPCNACEHCAAITRGGSLDVVEIDGASNRGIEEIRTLRESVPFAPTAGSFRVYIIDEVHMLTTEAFNALLKTLEEPPPHAKFIFATTAPNKVPPTILSRCQRFDFRRIETQALVEVLRRLAKAERVAIDEPALYLIARAADGSLRDAEVVLEQAASFAKGPITEADVTELLGAVPSEALFAWTQAVLDRDASKAVALLAAQLDQGKDAPQLLAGLLRQLRNLLILASTKDASSRDALLQRLIDEPADRMKRLEEQAGPLPAQELLLLLQVASGAYELARRSPMAQTVLELVVIKLATREQWRSLDEISRRLEQLGGTGDAGEPPRRLPGARTEPSAGPVQASTPGASDAAEPSPGEPSASPTQLSGAMAEVWPAFLERLGSQKMSLAAYLAESRPLEFSGSQLTVGLPGFALHQEVLSLPENRRLIDRLLTELCRTPITVQYAMLPRFDEPAQADAPQRADDAPVPPMVQDIVSLFNATLLDRPPRTT